MTPYGRDLVFSVHHDGYIRAREGQSSKKKKKKKASGAGCEEREEKENWRDEDVSHCC